MLRFLEEISQHTHHSKELKHLMRIQCAKIQMAYEKNNPCLLKTLVSQSKYTANPSDVVLV